MFFKKNLNLFLLLASGAGYWDSLGISKLHLSFNKAGIHSPTGGNVGQTSLFLVYHSFLGLVYHLEFYKYKSFLE